MEESTVSVIIPIFNVEKYLAMCVDSVLAQSYPNLEIILVDDGSPDCCPKICDKYDATDERIKVIHKQNGGLVSAWKAGFKLSTGKYIGFVDSDDWIDYDMYERLMDVAAKADADIVACNFIREEASGSRMKGAKERQILQAGEYNQDRIKHEILVGLINNKMGRVMSPNRVTKLFKRQLLDNNICFCDNEISYGEDLVVTFSCVCDAKRIIIMNDFYPYHYRINQLSITNQYDSKRINQINRLQYQITRIAEVKGCEITEQLANNYISLVLESMESEILFTSYSKTIVLKHIHNICTTDLFNQAFLNANTKRLPLKLKIWLFLIMCRKYRLIYFLRMTYSNTKSFFLKIKGSWRRD